MQKLPVLTVKSLQLAMTSVTSTLLLPLTCETELHYQQYITSLTVELEIVSEYIGADVLDTTIRLAHCLVTHITRFN